MNVYPIPECMLALSLVSTIIAAVIVLSKALGKISHNWVDIAIAVSLLIVFSCLFFSIGAWITVDIARRA